MSPQFAEILDHPSDTVAIVKTESFTIVECNSKFIEATNLTGKEIKGKSLFDVLDYNVSQEKKKKICSQVNSNGYCIEDYKGLLGRLHFNRIQVGSDDFCIVRLTTQINATQQYQSLFEKNVAGVFRTSMQGQVLSCNIAFARMLGYSSIEDVLFVNAETFYPNKSDRGSFIEALRHGGVVTNFEITLCRKDGVVITGLENTYLEIESDGSEVIIGTIIDISHQKKIEKELLESEDRFKTLSKVSHESVLFVKNEVIIDSNDQLHQLFRYSHREELIGMNVFQILNEDDFKRVTERIAISSSNKTDVRTQAFDGNILFLEVTGSAIKYKGQDVLVLVMNDITARKRAEFVMEQTAVRFKNLLENSPNAVLILTEDRIKYVNNSTLQLLGVEDEDELYDKNFVQFITGESKAAIRSDLGIIRSGGDVAYKEIRIKNKLGELLSVGIQSTLTIFENKPSIQVSLNNITERIQLVQEQMRVRIIEELNTVLKKEIEEHKTTQIKLLEQKNYTRYLIESSLDMIMASDEKGYITEFNKAAQEQFGYTLEEAMGKHSSLIYSDMTEFELVRGGMAEKGEFFGEVFNRKKSGESFPSLVSASLIRNENGEIIGSMGVSRDITDYRANERKALEQKAKLESIFNSTENMMMWTMDHHHRATSINSNFEKWMKSELNVEIQIGTQITEILRKNIDEDTYQGQLDAFELAFTGKPQQFEFAIKDGFNKTIWLQAFLNPVHLGDGTEEISCLVYDNTERKEVDKKVRDALKEKEVLLQEVHHRVKNNLQVISSILNLQSSYVTDERTYEILQESQNRIKSMSFIHETLYRTSDFTNINFGEYIKTLSYNLIQSYRLQDCDIHFEPHVDELTVNIDQAIPCGLIVNELLSNALKYAFKGRAEGRVSLDLHIIDKTVTLRISDDGVGLPKSFNYEKTDSLGIQLVYTLIEQLDGTVEVRSENGTEFLITFEKR